MKKYLQFFTICAVLIFTSGNLWAQTFPVVVTDQTPTAPLTNPTSSSYQPRYISGFGSENTFTVFFEDRATGYGISYVQTTSGPTGFPTSVTSTNITDTHFCVKDWPINIGGTDYAYRAWGAVGNNTQHHFYVSNDLINWTLVSTFTIPNATGFIDTHGPVYYGFHDVILINGTYYAFAETNQSATFLVRSTLGDDVWEAFASIGGIPGMGPLELPVGVGAGWTPSGSFVDLGNDRGYGKIHVDPRDSHFYLAINTAAKTSLAPAALEAAFINPANWTWNDGSVGPAANPILSETAEHDIRECWVVPSTDPDADWVIIYDADFGSADGGKALGYATLSPPLPPPTEVWIDDDYCDGCTNNGHLWGYDAFNNIQEGIDAVVGSTVNVAAGMYVEALFIDKPLTLLGATNGICKNGYTVPTGYAWDANLESIIVDPNPTVNHDATVMIKNVSNVTFDGFIVQQLNADARNIDALVYIYAWDNDVDNVNITNNVIGPFTNTTTQTGSNGGFGVVLSGGNSKGNNITNSTIACNKMFDTKGNGSCFMAIGGYHYNTGITPSNMAGTVIEDNEIYGSHRCGMEIVSGIDELTVRNNKIYNNTGYTTDDPNKLKFGSGILIIRGSADKLQNASNAYGPSNLLIEDNEIYDNQKNGIYMGPINNDYTFINNNLHDNGWDGIMLDMHGQYWNPTFEPTPTPLQHAVYNGSNNISANYNKIMDNGLYGVRVVGTPTNSFVLDATCNWWGSTDGPSGSGSGSGDAISGDITYLPWLLAPDGSCQGGTLRGTKLIVLSDLQNLDPEDEKGIDKNLEKAIKHLEKSLADELWEDSSYLTDKGKKVFDEEKKAVKELEKIIKDKKATLLKTESLEAIVKLVIVDKSLAQLLIDKAIEDGGDSKEIEKAEKEMEKATKELDKEDYDKTIDHYKKAWEHAYKALKKEGLAKYSTPAVELGVTTTPEKFSLGENYPNPFNPITTINYQLPEASQVTMTVYDMMGRQVKTLVQEFKPAGNHSVIWNATNDNGDLMSGGMYFYQIKTGSFLKTHKMILLK